MAVEQTLIATTRQGAPMAPFYNTITVRGEYATGTKVSSYGLGLTGGSTSSVSPGSIYTTHYEALWDGDLLIIRTGDHTGPRKETGVWHEQEERWRLISPGLLEIELHARGSEDGSRTEIARYVRQ
jgi:hypothetical protein